MTKQLFSCVLFYLVLNVVYGGFKPESYPMANMQPPKPNILMVLDTSGSMGTMNGNKGNDMTLPENFVEPGSKERHNVERIEVLRIVVAKLLKEYAANAYIGFAKLGYASPHNRRSREVANGFDILFQPVVDLTQGNQLTEAITTTEKLIAYSWTPMAFSIYEAAKHLRGEALIEKLVKGKPVYKAVMPSPVRYRCQQQHMILLTDGEKNSDGIYGVLKGDTIVKEKTDSLETLGEQFWALDLRNARGKQISDRLDSAGKSWDAAGFEKLPIALHAIRFGFEKNVDDMLKSMVKHSKGVYASAENTLALDLAFHKIFQAIIATKSGAESIEDQPQRSVNGVRYTNNYNPSAWTSEIKAFGYDIKTQTYDHLLWTTGNTIVADQGRFITLDAEASHGAVPLSAENLGLTLPNSEAMVEWLKGQVTSSVRYPLRQRDSLLGDIVESHPVYSARDFLNINLSTLTDEKKNAFINFLIKKNQHSHNLLIAGSNDGLINFIFAHKNPSGLRGQRYTSYFPSFFKERIEEITVAPYSHTFHVNGNTTLFDAHIGHDFKTIGITTLAAGGMGIVGYTIYSVDQGLQNSGDAQITPNFEITSTTPYFSDLGYTYTTPAFFNRQATKEDDPKALAVFGNGFGNKSGHSIVYIIDAFTGQFIHSILLNKSGGGASSPALVVATNAQTGLQEIERLYVGDYQGNLYKVTFSQGRDIQVNFTTTLFEAGNGSSIGTRPISVAPLLVQGENNDLWIYFGTGLAADKAKDKGAASKVTHNFYALKDPSYANDTLITEEKLQRQDMLSLVKDKESKYEKIMTTNNSSTSYSLKSGWYLPLIDPVAGKDQGERILRPAALYRSGYIHFVTWGIREGEDNDPCQQDEVFGKSLMLKAFSGNAANLDGVKNVSGIAALDDAFGLMNAPELFKQSFVGGEGNAMTNSLLREIKQQLITDSGFSNHVPDEERLNSSFAFGGTQNDDTASMGLPSGSTTRTQRVYFFRKL